MSAETKSPKEQVMSLFDHSKSDPLTAQSINRLTHHRYIADPKGIRAAVRELVAEGVLHKARGWDYDDGWLVGMWFYFWPVGRPLRSRSGRPERPAMRAEESTDA